MWTCSGEAAARRRLFNQMADFGNVGKLTHCATRTCSNVLNWACRCFCVCPHGYSLLSMWFPVRDVNPSEHNVRVCKFIAIMVISVISMSLMRRPTYIFLSVQKSLQALASHILISISTLLPCKVSSLAQRQVFCQFIPGSDRDSKPGNNCAAWSPPCSAVHQHPPAAFSEWSMMQLRQTARLTRLTRSCSS